MSVPDRVSLARAVEGLSAHVVASHKRTGSLWVVEQVRGRQAQCRAYRLGRLGPRRLIRTSDLQAVKVIYHDGGTSKLASYAVNYPSTDTRHVASGAVGRGALGAGDSGDDCILSSVGAA